MPTAAKAETKPLVVAPTTLAGKLLDAVREVDHVDKDGFNKFHGYHYTSAEAVYRALREPLLSRGLLLLPSAVELTQNTERVVDGKTGEVSDGSTSSLVELVITIKDVASGEAVEFRWFGEGRDNGDKGPYKAFTGGLKTFLRHLFMLPADDDPEADEATDKRGAKKGGSAKAGGGKASEKQVKFVETLVKKLGIGPSSAPPLSQVMGWAATLSKAQAGKALDYLNDDDRDKAAKLKWLASKVAEFASKADALPGADSFEGPELDAAGFTDADPGKPDDQPTLLDEDGAAEAEGTALAGGPYDPELS